MLKINLYQIAAQNRDMKIDDVIQDLTIVKPKESQTNRQCKRLSEENAKKLLSDDRLSILMGEFSTFPEYPLDENSCFNDAMRPPSPVLESEGMFFLFIFIK